MSIRQQGGIFGRSPTFNNVTVDGVLTVDQVVEKTGAAGITLDGVTLKDGNVVLANGKGIDFSATSGTGTSELFDDYEEGTWTVEFRDASSGGNVSSTTYIGQYIKIGAVVHCWFNAPNINENGLTDANNLYFNLPFVAGARGSCGSCRTGAITYPAGATVITPVTSTSAYGWFFASGDGVNAAVLTCGALNSGDSSDFSDVTLTYTTI